MSRILRPHGIVLLATAGAVMALARPIEANVISFDTVSLGPGSTLQVGDATVTGPQVETVAGTGLGIADGFIDAVLTLTDTLDTGSNDGPISLSVNGTINSVTIVPYLKVAGGDPCSTCDFSISYRSIAPDSPSFLQYLTVVPGQATVVSFADMGFGLPNQITDFGVYGDFGEEPYFSSYMWAHGWTPATFEFGFTLLSLDYTPTDPPAQPVPEPSTDTMVALGLLGAAFAACRGRRARLAPSSR